MSVICVLFCMSLYFFQCIFCSFVYLFCLFSLWKRPAAIFRERQAWIWMSRFFLFLRVVVNIFGTPNISALSAHRQSTGIIIQIIIFTGFTSSASSRFWRNNPGKQLPCRSYFLKLFRLLVSTTKNEQIDQSTRTCLYILFLKRRENGDELPSPSIYTDASRRGWSATRSVSC